MSSSKVSCHPIVNECLLHIMIIDLDHSLPDMDRALICLHRKFMMMLIGVIGANCQNCSVHMYLSVCSGFLMMQVACRHENAACKKQTIVERSCSI